MVMTQGQTDPNQGVYYPAVPGGSAPSTYAPPADQSPLNKQGLNINDYVKLGTPQGGAPTSGNPLPDSAWDPSVAGSNEVWSAYRQIYGRNPTSTELAQAAPYAVTSNPHVGSQGQVNAYVANLLSQEQNSPANLYSRQQAQWAQQAQDPKTQASVNQIFQSTLGRQATADEMTHYGTLLASGQGDAYQIGQFLQSLPEYQNAQDTQFRQGLDTQLQQSDQAFFNKTKGDITQQYALMGRATSPALDVALTDMAAQLNDNRQNYLAQLSASQYGGNKAAAMANYGNTQQDVMSKINQNYQSQYQNIQNNQQQGNDWRNYLTQQSAWQDAMSRYGNRQPGALDYLNAGANAAKAGVAIAGLF